MRALLILVSSLALVACDSKDGKRGPVPSRRADGVPAGELASGSADPATATAKKPSDPAAPAPKRKLCAGQTERDTPEGLEVARSVSGPAPEPLSYGERWVWINVWAAWCAPCKEELPMLIEWRERLRKQGVKLDLAFVSIDDDEREMKRLLSSQPEGGMRASYWLADDENREGFFESLGFEDTPTLPVHAFVGPAGKLRCTVEGALEPGDYEAVASFFGQ